MLVNNIFQNKAYIKYQYSTSAQAAVNKMTLQKYNENLFKVSLSNPLYRQDVFEEEIDINVERPRRVIYITFEKKIKEKDFEEIYKALNKFGQTQKVYRRKESKTIFCEFVEQVNINQLIVFK